MHATWRRLRALAYSAAAAAAIASAGVTGNAAASGRAETVRRPTPRTSTARHYRGLTSQHQPISFTLSSGHVSKLSFWVVISCASHRRYSDRAFRFAPIPVVKGRFQRSVASAHPSANATVRGRVSGRRVTGTLRLRRYIGAEHGYCAGTASFVLTVPARTHASLRRQPPGTTI